MESVSYKGDFGRKVREGYGYWLLALVILLVALCSICFAIGIVLFFLYTYQNNELKREEGMKMFSRDIFMKIECEEEEYEDCECYSVSQGNIWLPRSTSSAFISPPLDQNPEDFSINYVPEEIDSDTYISQMSMFRRQKQGPTGLLYYQCGGACYKKYGKPNPQFFEFFESTGIMDAKLVCIQLVQRFCGERKSFLKKYKVRRVRRL